MISRFDVLLVSLEPTVGSEIRKTRLCLVVSPDEMNHVIGTVIVAPMTTKGRIVLDRLRTIDKARVVTRLGTIHGKTGMAVLAVLGEMFTV